MFDKVEYRIGFGVEYDRHNHRIPYDQRIAGIERVKADTLSRFGGYTLADTFGGWLDSQGNEVVEDGQTLSIIAFDDDEVVAKFARWVGRELSQHSVVFIKGERACILPC